MKTLLMYLAVLTLISIGVSCSSSDDSMPSPSSTETVVTYTATLVPVTGITSSGSGAATLKMNPLTKTFDITVTYAGITPTHGHIHRTDGQIAIPFDDTTVATSPFRVTGSLTDEHMAGILTGTYYVNLHTAANVNGEISGMLTKTGGSTGGGPSY